MSYLEEVQAPKNNLQEVEFNFLVTELFSKLDGTSRDNLGAFSNITSKKNYIIQSFIDQWKEHIGLDVYPAARLIFPNRDKRLYFIKDVTLARTIIKVFSIPKKSVDYEKLISYKQHYHNYKHLNKYGTRHSRSLPLLIAQVISERRDEIVKPSLSIQDVNGVLDKLCSPEASTIGIQREIIKDTIDKMSIEEIRWFMEIILKKSILGYFEVIFLRCWHPDAPRLINICGSLNKVFWCLTDPQKRLSQEELNVQILFPFLPQLSHKLSISYDQLCDKMNHDFIIEEKMDGDRMIMHMKDSKFKFFSRRKKDYSLLYGTNYQIGSLTKYLTNAFDSRVKSVILDGEMLAWDYKRNVILPFGTLKSTAIQEAVRQFTTTDMFDNQSSWPLFIIFDILHLNGHDLTEFPLAYRKNVLEEIIRPVPHKFEILKYKKGSSVEDIKASIRNIISDRSEGIMVKNSQLTYHVASRNNCWVKVKPEYLEQFGENLDLIVIGVIPGIKNSYMCGLKDEDTGRYKSFCTVANGFSEAEFDSIDRLTFGKWVRYNEKLPPTELIELGTKKPTLWIDPKNSVVLEIRARSIDSSPTSTYAVGTTLHNLYSRRIREDKLYEDCATLSEYREMKLKYSEDFLKSQSIIKNRKAMIDSFEENFKKKLEVPLESRIFKGIKFLILTGMDTDFTYGKADLDEIYKAVKRNGGTLTHSPYNIFKKPVVIISDRLTGRSSIYLNKGYDVIKPCWIYDCISMKRLVSLEPSHVLATNSKALKEVVERRVDRFGDSYTRRIDEPLKQYLDELSFSHRLDPKTFRESQDSFLEDLKYLEVDPPLGLLFRDISFHLLALESYQGYPVNALRRRILRFLGNVADLESCSYVVVPRVYNLQKYRDELVQKVKSISETLANCLTFTDFAPSKIPHIVRESFVDDCIKNRVLVDPRDHLFT